MQQHPALLTEHHLFFAPAHCTEKKQGKPMTYGAMYAIMKKLLPLCGMAKEEAGCHSFRRGTATGLAHINAPSYVIKGIGILGQRRPSRLHRRHGEWGDGNGDAGNGWQKRPTRQGFWDRGESHVSDTTATIKRVLLGELGLGGWSTGFGKGWQ